MKSRLREYFGFTQREVEQIMRDSGYQKEAERIRMWYDGYHFGEFDMYCPWDVLNYVYDLQEQEEMSQPVSYWRNTSDNSVIRSFLDHKQNLITAKLETLLGGGYIIQEIAETRAKIEQECDAALSQIENRGYAEEFLESGNAVLCYGIAFYKKECLVKRV